MHELKIISILDANSKPLKEIVEWLRQKILKIF